MSQLTLRHQIEQVRKRIRNLPRELKEARVTLKLSQTDWAKLFGLDQSAVSRIENGMQEVPINMAVWLVERDEV